MEHQKPTPEPKFWEWPDKSREKYIRDHWPDATWAGNGQVGVWAISINLERE